MTVAFDATSGSAAIVNTATTATWTHTPVGVPAAICVVIPQDTSADQISGVSYGGVALSRIRSDSRTVTEACRTYVYFLGVGIPTGAQTVAVVSTGTAAKWPQSLTWTAAKDCSVTSQVGADAGIIANPSLTLTPPAQAGCVYVNASGLNAPVSTPEAGTTQAAARDLGTTSGHIGYKTAGGTTTIGWTSASDDVCHSAIAITELIVVERSSRPVVSPTRAVRRSYIW